MPTINPMTITGGIRIGESYWQATNYSWPLVTLNASEDEIVLAMSFKKLTLPRSEIAKISSYRGIMSDGVQIEHSSSGTPCFVVFWTKPSRVANQLLSLGYPYQETDDKGSAVPALKRVGLIIPIFVLSAIFVGILVHEREVHRGLPDALLNAAGLTSFLAIIFFVLRARILR